MRPILWDDGTRWDDINARWSDPSFVLEPGDEGYRIPSPPPGTISKTKTNKKTMSSNATPRNQDLLSNLARRIHAGQVSDGASVGLLHHLAPEMDASIKKLDGDPSAIAGSAANKGSQLVYRESILASQDADGDLAVLSESTVKLWLEGYQRVMDGVHGLKANAGWQAAGFAPGTTAVPRPHGERLSLLIAARAYLGAHPSFEVTLPQNTGPGLEITSVKALELQAMMTAANTNIGIGSALQTAAKITRDADVNALYDEVSATIAELRDLLADNDARWEIFGLNIPANPNPPGAVTSLTITAAGTGRELFSWPYAVRVEYFRVFLKRVGIDVDFVNVADARDLEYIAKGLLPGTTIEGFVVPMNDGGAGPASPTVSKVVGV